MAASFAAVQTLMEAAVTAMAAAEYSTARDKALAAQMLLAVLPNTTQGTAGGGSDGLSWDRVAVSKIVDQCTALANASRGMQSSRGVSQPTSANGDSTRLGTTW